MEELEMQVIYRKDMDELVIRTGVYNVYTYQCESEKEISDCIKDYIKDYVIGE